MTFLVFFIVPLIIGLVAQSRVKSTFARNLQVPIANGLSGAEVARRDGSGRRRLGRPRPRQAGEPLADAERYRDTPEDKGDRDEGAMPRADAWGHVFIEAMGYGLPCIGTAICAMPEIIDDGVTGRLVARGEPEPLASAMIELLSDPEKSERMGRAAHARVLEQLTWSHVADRFIEHLPRGSGR